MKQLRPYQQKAVKETWDALKQDDSPVLLMASVGAGKSLMLANILLTMQKAGKRALCLVNNAELVRNNCVTFRDEGGNSSIYCAALNCKDCSAPIVFGTPQSVLNGINKDEPIAKIKFNIIVVDEAHAINFNNHRSSFMRILRHYKQEYPSMRLLGATGTNFRFKGTPIVGNDALFKTQVGNITTEWLIEEGYLIEPHFEIDRNLVLDFTQVKVKKNGLFDQKQLETVIDQSTRLTELISAQIVHVMETQKRRGVFIFASTKKHAQEIYNHLPKEESAIILGEMPQHERTVILDKARKGEIRYLVNIAIISVGVDIPSYDTIAYMRPTESLVLLVQTMGRALRLSPSTNKTEALILDFAGNIERHSDWDNPVLMDAVKKSLDKDKPLVIQCPQCNEMNTESARRCTGIAHDSESNTMKRCSYYFEFKECEHEFQGGTCGAKNDLVARECHKCHGELIDPNAKLSLDALKKPVKEVKVLEAAYGISDTQKGFRINAAYKCEDDQGRIGSVFEHYSPISEKASRVFYGQFVRKHCKDSSKWYPHLQKRDKVEELLKEVDTPVRLLLAREQDQTKIKKKIFL